MRRLFMIIAAVITIGISVYASDDGCILDLEFDGNYSDTSGKNNEVTSYNTEISQNYLVMSRPGNLKLGESFYQSLSGLEVITMSAWFYAEQPAPAADYIFYCPVSDSKAGLEVYIDSIGIRVSGRSCHGDLRFSKKYGQPELDCWNYIAVTWDFKNKSIECYLNGEYMESDSQSSRAGFLEDSFCITSENNCALIGHRNEFNTYEGKIDSFRIYQRRLSEEEITNFLNEKSSYGISEEMRLTEKLEQQLEGKTVLKYNSNLALNNLQFEKIGDTDKHILLKYNGDYYLPQEYIKKYTDAETETMQIYGIEYARLNPENIKEYDGFLTIPADTRLNEEQEEELNRRFEQKASLLCMPEGVTISEENTRGLYLGSPSIVKAEDSTIIVSHDYFGPKNKNMHVIYHSYDDGKTFERVSQIKGITWGTLFFSKGTLFIIGTDKVYGAVVIAKSEDNGITWSDTNVLFDDTMKYHTAPTAILHHGGRIYKAFESAEEGSDVSKYGALVISADEDSDLTDAGSWTKTNTVRINKEILAGMNYFKAGWLEGNMVADADGGIYNILRTTIAPYANKAIVLRLETDEQLSQSMSLIDLPGGSHKFTVRYDEASRKYIALVNSNTERIYFNKRNSLALAYSSNLNEWDLSGDIIFDSSILPLKKSVMSKGFQYADYVISGDDLYAVVRQGDNNYHDSNRIVFYKYKNFRNDIKAPEPVIQIDFDSQDYNLSNSNISLCDGFRENGVYVRDGKNDTYVYCDNLSKRLEGSEAICVSMKIRIDELKDTAMPLFKCFSEQSQGGIIAYIDKNGKIRIEARSYPGEKLSSLTSETTVRCNVWHSVTMCADFKNKRLQLYIDGSLDKQTENAGFEKNLYTAGNPQIPDMTFLGYGSSVFSGYADEIEVYNEMLSPQDIKRADEVKTTVGNNGIFNDELYGGKNSFNIELNPREDGKIFAALYERNTGKLIGIKEQEISKNQYISTALDMNVQEDFYNYYFRIFIWNDALVPQQ